MINLDFITNPENKYGPIQIIHDFQFVALNVSEDYSFINDLSFEQRLEHMIGRLKRLYDCGYGGVVLNINFEKYLEDEESFVLLDKAIDAAKDMGLRVWIYDEQYYPSGSAGGHVLAEHPELEAQGLVCVKKEVEDTDAAIRISSPHGHTDLIYAFAVPFVNGKYDYTQKIDISKYKGVGGGLCWDCKGGKWLIYCYFIRALYEMTYLAFSFRASRRYPNIADKKAMERFVSITYKNYEKFLKQPLGSRIEAVFTDEPSLMFYLKYPDDRSVDDATQYKSISIYDKPDLDIPAYPYVPWVSNINEVFFEEYNYKITDFLPELFDETEQTQKIRCDFYGLISKMVENAYLDTLLDYTSSQKMLLSGHYLREECFNRHPFMYGDILRHLGRMNIPGCDMLFSSPNELRYSVSCKLASSAAHIYHREHSMIEASNMLDCNQEFNLDDMIETMSMIFAHGIDTITSYYGERCFSDKDTKKFTRYVSRLGKLFEGGKNKISALLYYPFEMLCAARIPDGPEFNECTMLDSLGVRGSAELLFKNQIGFDFINKENLLRCEINPGALVTDYNESVSAIFFPEVSFVDEQVSVFLETAHKAGVRILFEGNSRKIEGLNFFPEFYQPCEILSVENQNLHISHYVPDIIYLQKCVDDTNTYLIVNTGDKEHTLTVDVIVSIPCAKIIDMVSIISSRLNS